MYTISGIVIEVLAGRIENLVIDVRGGGGVIGSAETPRPDDFIASLHLDELAMLYLSISSFLW